MVGAGEEQKRLRVRQSPMAAAHERGGVPLHVLERHGFHPSALGATAVGGAWGRCLAAADVLDLLRSSYDLHRSPQHVTPFPLGQYLY